MKLKGVANLFIFVAMVSIIIGLTGGCFKGYILFQRLSFLGHLVFANTCLLIALVLKLAND